MKKTTSSYVTLGTGTSFAGTIIAQASITSASNTQTTGRLIALTDAVSLNGATPTTITVSGQYFDQATNAVPEFGSLAAIILVVAITSIVVVFTKTGLNNFEILID